jgi:hypothetical protein
VANCVNARMKAMEAVGSHAARDPRVRESAAEQLRRVEHPVIALGHLGDAQFWLVFGRLLSHSESKSPIAPNLAPLAAQFDAFGVALNRLSRLR